jgi:hypothetical protein
VLGPRHDWNKDIKRNWCRRIVAAALKDGKIDAFF